MKTIKFIIFVLLPAVLIMTGCKLEDPAYKSSPFYTGNADFSRYVAVGNSLTAGYQSGGLTQIFQEVSFPAMIAKQARVDTFRQPLMAYPGVGVYLPDGGVLYMKYLDNPQTPNTINPDPVIEPVSTADYGFDWQNPYINDEVANWQYQNLGIPGAKLNDIIDVSYSIKNPYFKFVLHSNIISGKTAMQQAMEQNPTFITCWIGNNDVLGYATDGGVGAPTPVDEFERDYRILIDSLSSTGADMVTANIPDVTSIPFFTTIPPIVIDPDKNIPVVDDQGNNVPLLGVNPATDLVLITAKTALAQGYGIPQSLGGNGEDLPDEYVLDASEIAVAKEAVSNFNAIIASVCAEKNIPVVDVNTFMNDVAAHGLELNGFTFTSKLVTGGLFSFDGVHPSTAGYAIIANLWIDAINENFDASIPHVDILDYMVDIPAPVPAVGKAVYGISSTAGFKTLNQVFGVNK